MSHVFEHMLTEPPSLYHGQVLSFGPKVISWSLGDHAHLTLSEDDSKNHLGAKYTKCPKMVTKTQTF